MSQLNVKVEEERDKLEVPQNENQVEIYVKQEDELFIDENESEMKLIEEDDSPRIEKVGQATKLPVAPTRIKLNYRQVFREKLPTTGKRSYSRIEKPPIVPTTRLPVATLTRKIPVPPTIIRLPYRQVFREKLPVPEPFCKECDRLFKSNQALKKHKERYHEGKLFPRPKSDDEPLCHTCGTKFKNSTRLKEHIDRKHLNIKNFQCDQCPMRFYKKESLRGHILKHIPKEHRNYNVPCGEWEF